MIVKNNFISNYRALDEYLDTAVFQDEVNPFDGVTYPLICRDIPKDIELDVIDAITSVFRFPENRTMFLRRSPKGVHCPHKVHSDNSMGKYSLMVYLDDAYHGTSFLEHKATGAMDSNHGHPIIDEIIKDQNNDDAWRVYQMNYAAKNRGVIFDASLLHRAEPVGGYGEGRNARTVLTCFFS